jgi:hypothetical protein
LIRSFGLENLANVRARGHINVPYPSSVETGLIPQFSYSLEEGNVQKLAMPIVIDNEEYYNIEESCKYLGGISRETLRRRTEEAGIQKFTRGVTRRVYYRKSDLDRLNEFRPKDDNSNN